MIQSRQTTRLTARLTGLALLLPALLGGCDAIYDDTKGWANRLEASILGAAHEMTEPAPAEAPQPAPEAAMKDTMSEQMTPPPAVPVERVDTAALDAPESQPSLAPLADRAPAPAMPAHTEHRPDGAVAAASNALLTGQAETPTDSAAAQQAAVPMPKPRPKPAAPASAEMAAKPADHTADAPDAAHAMVLHLSSLRSEEAAKREWSDLQHSFPEPLGQMHAEFRRTDLGDKGTFYRVLAGPLPSREEAKQVCAALKAKDAKQYCHIMPSNPKG